MGTSNSGASPSRLGDLPTIELGGGLRVALATSLRSRALGLCGMRELPASLGLLIPRCRSVHTFGMRFAIDLLFLDRACRAVALREGVPPGRIAICRRAAAVLEVAHGAGPRFALHTPISCAAPTFP